MKETKWRRKTNQTKQNGYINATAWQTDIHMCSSCMAIISNF